MPESFTAPVSPLPTPLIISSALTLLAAARLHAKTAHSIANAVLGLMHSPSLSVTDIGTSLARVTGHDAKHGVKQVDRLMSNDNFKLADCFRAYIRFVIGLRSEITVAFDWTEYSADGHSTICLSLVTGHGRATPLLWMSVDSSTLKDRRNSYEDEILHNFKACLPPKRQIKVIVVADRGFGDVALYQELKDELGFDFVIRFRGNVLVEAENGMCKRADEWFAEAKGRGVIMSNVKVTHKRVQIASFVAVKDPLMAEPWFLASSLTDSLRSIVHRYGRRFTIEETFRDQKDPRFGWGLSEVQVTQPLRRDRLLFIAAIAQVLLTLTGAAGEELGLDVKLRVNTVKRRTHSLLRQGREYLRGLIDTVAQALQERFHSLFADLANTMEHYALI